MTQKPLTAESGDKKCAICFNADGSLSYVAREIGRCDKCTGEQLAAAARELGLAVGTRIHQKIEQDIMNALTAGDLNSD